jgi:DNA-binding GntR family transcriptional regulator
MNTDHNTIAKDAYQEVKELIFDRKIPHDQEIVVGQIARQFHIAHEQLHAVLNRLVKEGVLTESATQQYRVRLFQDFEIVELFNTRIALETLGAKLFAIRAPQSKIDDLRSLLIPFGKGPTNPKIYNRIDCHFHMVIMKHTGNPFLWHAYNAGQLSSYMALVGLLRSPKEIFDEHLNIVSAMHKREPELAACLMRQHLEQSKAIMLNKL